VLMMTNACPRIGFGNKLILIFLLKTCLLHTHTYIYISMILYILDVGF